MHFELISVDNIPYFRVYRFPKNVKKTLPQRKVLTFYLEINTIDN